MKLNLQRLKSIQTTLGAIEDINKAINWYKEDVAGPAYMNVSTPGSNEVVYLQFDRNHFHEFMTARRDHLINHLQERFEGFEYDPEAHWSGDSDV